MEDNNKKGLIILLIIPIVLVILLVGYIIYDNTHTDSYEEETSDFFGEELDYYEMISEYFDVFSVDEFVDVFNEEEENDYVVIVANTMNEDWEKLIKNMKEVQDSLDFTAYYVDLDETTEDEEESIRNIDEFFEENYDSGLMVVIVKDGKFYKGFSGYKSKSKLKFFLKDAKI